MTTTTITTTSRERAARRRRRPWVRVRRRVAVERRRPAPSRARLRASVTLLAVALALAGLLIVAPASARAGTYTVESCTNGSTSGWAPFQWGLYSGWGNSCGVPGGSMAAAISIHPASTAGWTFTAPADTEIAGFRISRSYRLAANQPFGTSVVTTMTGPARVFYDARPNLGGALDADPHPQGGGGLRGETTLTARLDCGGGSVCTGNSLMHLHGASIDLRDDTPPVIGSVSGSLLAAGALKGARAITYAAHDKGGGVRREQLVVDGAVVAERAPGCSFALPVPCSLAVSGTLGVDTARLAEGEHDATLVVSDATLANHGTHGPFRFTVDNVPPPRSTSPPRITGTVALYADDGAWIGAGLVFARRWQRLEEGTWEDIPGAESALYTPGAEDAGRRLRFRVRATNAEGSAEAYSEPTPRLPALPGPTPTPTPTATPAMTPTPAPVTVAAAPALAAAPVAAKLTAAFASSGRTVVTLRWGERRKVTGTLATVDGRPLAGERIAVSSRLRATGAVALPLGHVTTDGAGRFAFLPPAGASRTLTFVHGERQAALTVHVVPKVTIRVARSGRIDGRVSGAPPGIAKLVQLQGLHGRTWRTFATTRLKPTGGAFTHRPRTRVRRVRARVVAEPGWPFVTGTSAVARP